MADEKVVFALSDVTVHEKTGEVKSVFGEKETVEAHTLRPGETFPFDKLATYQQDDFENGRVPAVEVMSKSAAEKKVEEVNKLRQMASGLSNVDYDATSFVYPPGHSDHEVSFEERAENHAARAEEEAGEAGPKETRTARGRKVEGEDASTSTLKEEESGTGKSKG